MKLSKNAVSAMRQAKAQFVNAELELSTGDVQKSYSTNLHAWDILQEGEQTAFNYGEALPKGYADVYTIIEAQKERIGDKM